MPYAGTEHNSLPAGRQVSPLFMDNHSDKKLIQAQLKEVKHAKEAATAEKKAAQAEREVAQTTKGGARVAQPDDVFML